MSEAVPAFLQSYALDGRGGARALSPTEVKQWKSEGQGLLWVHIDIADSASSNWVSSEADLEDPVVDTLLAEETRPRSIVTERGLLVVLRGVNTNPGEDPEDMVSVRVWIERDRIISTRRRRLLSLLDIKDELDRGAGPRSAGAFLSTLIERLADRIGEFVDTIEDRLSDAEDALAGGDTQATRQRLGALRRQIASVRRFLAPQRDALDRLYRQPGSWLSEEEVQHLREEADRITRYLEDLDLARERAVVLQEEFLSQLAQEQNTRMYVLSVVAAVFLPLTFVTGLLGMNVGGLPGVESPGGFFWAVIVMVAAGAALVAFFRWKKWI